MTTLDLIIRMLAVVGAGGVVVLVICVVALWIDNLKSFIDAKKYERKRKHRFDKPPTAPCYCIDCVYREYNGLCSKGTINHSCDAWFCADGKPCKHEPKTEE